MLTIPAPLLSQIEAHALSSYPNECCGILVGSRQGGLRTVSMALPAGNLNRERARDRYLMDPKDQLAAQKEARLKGLDVLGYYHSHPDHPALPSATDDSQSWEDVSYLIIGVTAQGCSGRASFIRSTAQAMLGPEPLEVLP